jgi:hypothetical protein
MRLWLSRLADASVRRAAARWLLALCVFGFVVSLVAIAGLGYGLDRWIFLLLVWTVLVFIPLRIAIDSAGRLGAGLRQAVATRIAADPARYEKPAYLAAMVDDLTQRVTLPRICQPQHRRAAAAAAAALIARVNAAPQPRCASWTAIGTVLAVVGQEASRLSAGASGAAPLSIQARWEAARALGSLGALLVVVAAAHEDRWGKPGTVPGLRGRTLEDYAAAAMDYCDEVALQADAAPWTEPPLHPDAPSERAEAVWAAWLSFLTAGLPAPRALDDFVATTVSGVWPEH